MSEKLPGDGVWGWLGRQIGHVKAAVHHDPVAPHTAPAAAPASETGKPPEAAGDQPPEPPKIVYRNDTVQELPHPTRPNLKLRRTVIDEVIVDDAAADAAPPREEVDAERAADRREKEQE